MLSRVANSIYWMSRYIERAENIARFIDVNLHLDLDREAGVIEQWSPLVSITGDSEQFETHYDAATRQNVMRFLSLDRAYPNSIASCVAAARENARTIRDAITSEMWQQINALYIAMQRAEDSSIVGNRSHDFYTEIKSGCLLFNAITDATMSHSTGWDFCTLGRMLERADKTSRILDVKYFLLLPSPEAVGTTIDTVQWGALLHSAGALEMYRQRYGAITPDRVAAFLILDPDFPRSLAHCLVRAERSLLSIVHPTDPPPRVNLAQRKIGRLRSSLEFGDVNEMIDLGLHEYLDAFQDKLNDIDVALNGAFFQFEPPQVRDYGAAQMVQQ